MGSGAYLEGGLSAKTAPKAKRKMRAKVWNKEGSQGQVEYQILGFKVNIEGFKFKWGLGG